jgi:hypothetical protein
MQVIDVEDLGRGAAKVRIEGEEILLVEASLDVDERIELLTHVMERNSDDDLGRTCRSELDSSSAA